MSKTPVISHEQLKLGYKGAIENAFRFFGAATDLCSKYPDKALALAQLGQEEVGKSLTLLAAFSLPPNEEAWKWFWQDWASHQTKAHRAFIYELVNPFRLELISPAGDVYSGLPLRNKIHQEKESGLYLDFDFQNLSFISPVNSVTPFEAIARASTLSYLVATANAIQRALFHADEDFRLSTFSEIAFRICTEQVYQQDMPWLLEEFRRRSPRHEQVILDLAEAFKTSKTDFQDVLSKANLT
jgi:AbiV family abortive infection protein